MGAATEIAWTDATFNPWWGCVRVSPGCENCYAESFAKRTGNAVWGVQAPRRFFPDKHWSEPRKWNAAAEKAGIRKRVFCASMADAFERREELDPWRAKLFALIEETPWLDWQLLTKRPEAGYLSGNVVACCTECNFRKGNADHGAFLNWVRAVASRHAGNDLVTSVRIVSKEASAQSPVTK